MRDPLALAVDRMQTPIGELVIVTDEAGRLRAVDWSDHEARMLRLLRLHYGDGGVRLVPAAGAGAAHAALRAYFQGSPGAIANVEAATGGTAFQRRVWAELRRIPCGTAISYRDLAGRIGRPSAVRAVGAANAANPVGIVVPCHRVVGSHGALTGYGGGIARKRWLLAHEGAVLPRTDDGRHAQA